MQFEENEKILNRHSREGGRKGGRDNKKIIISYFILIISYFIVFTSILYPPSLLLHPPLLECSLLRTGSFSIFLSPVFLAPRTLSDASSTLNQINGLSFFLKKLVEKKEHIILKVTMTI